MRGQPGRSPGKRHALRAAGSGAEPAAGVVGPARQGQRASSVQLPARCSEPEPRRPAAGSQPSAVSTPVSKHRLSLENAPRLPGEEADSENEAERSEVSPE